MGRITKNMRRLGFEADMEAVLFDSSGFPHLNKKEKTKYIETVVGRMEKQIGWDNTKQVLQECGAQCCGRSWESFAKRIKDQSKSLEDFFVNLNQEEEQYNTHIVHDSAHRSITVVRDRCICGLINKGNIFSENSNFCQCSIGHMSTFFNAVLKVEDIQLKHSIYAGDEWCEWVVRWKDD